MGLAYAALPRVRATNIGVSPASGFANGWCDICLADLQQRNDLAAFGLKRDRRIGGPPAAYATGVGVAAAAFGLRQLRIPLKAEPAVFALILTAAQFGIL